MGEKKKKPVWRPDIRNRRPTGQRVGPDTTGEAQKKKTDEKTCVAPQLCFSQIAQAEESALYGDYTPKVLKVNISNLLNLIAVRRKIIKGICEFYR